MYEIAQLLKDLHKDQYETFGSYIAAQLRELPTRNFIILQAKIQEIVVAERLSCLTKIVSPQSQSDLGDNSQDITNGRNTSSAIQHVYMNDEPIHGVQDNSEFSKNI